MGSRPPFLCSSIGRFSITEEQFYFLRLVVVILWVVLRMLTPKVHLQSRLFAVEALS